MYPYQIRLRGPWDCEPLVSAQGGELPAKCKMTIPCRWSDGGLGDFAGKVRFVRHFGYPSNLDAHEHLWLTFGGIADRAEVWLNGQLLGKTDAPDKPFEFEVTPLMQPRNELKVDVEGSSRGGICGEVALEVRCSAFLRNVRFQAAPAGALATLQVNGDIVGQTDSPLELYLLLDGKTLSRGPVQASPHGTPFEIIADGLKVNFTQANQGGTARLYRARVDLVSGPVVWYMVEEVVEFRR